MIKEPYKDIPEKYVSIVKSLIADDDTYHQGHARRMALTLQTLAENYPEGKLLEVGTSHLMPIAIKELGLNLEVSVTDFDLTKEYSGRMECSLNGKTAEVDVYRVNIEESSIPVPDETFDVVLLCEVIEHMEVDPMFMLSEMNRIIKHGGKLIISTPNSTSSRNIHKILNGYEPYFYMQYRHDGSLYRHNYEYSVPTLKAVLKAAGFQGKFWTEDTFEDGIYSTMLRLEMIGFQLKNLGDNIFAVTQKFEGVVDRYPKEIYVD